MINYYSGTPGSGKSLHVAQVIEDYLRCGKNVIANFEFRDDLVKKKWLRDKGQFVYFPDAQIMDNTHDPVNSLVGFDTNFHKKNKNGATFEDQTLLVFDEAGILFNSRDWQSKYRPRWLWFFAQHRKLGFNVIIISQAERQIDRQVRACFEYDYVHRRIGNYKKLGRFLEIITFSKLFSYTVHWYGVSGQDAKSTPVFFRGRKRYYGMYNTAKMFGCQDA